MKLQYKTLIIFWSMWAVILLLLFLDSRMIIAQDYQQLENKIMLKEMGKVEREFARSLHSLEIYTLAWAQWDDAYQFMHDKNPEFIATNFVHGTFTSSNINFFFFFDKEGEFFYGKSYDQDKKEIITPPAMLVDYLQNQKKFIQHDLPQSSKAGIMRAPKGLVMLASLPVIKGDGSGPVNGALLMGHYLDKANFSAIGQEAGHDIVFHALPLDNANQVLAKADKALMQGAEAFIYKMDRTLATGYFYLRDIDNMPVGIIEVSMEREVHLQGISTANHYLLMLLIVGVFVAGIMWYLLKHYVLDRIVDVSEQVMKINERDDFSGKITISGNDEINMLATYINKMTGLISVSQKKLNYMVHHDSLTGLPNRLAFHEFFSERIASSEFLDKKLALLFLDINNFKYINDKYGHAFGDKVLQHISQCLMTCIEKNDMVCRISGDEFVVCYHEVIDREEVTYLLYKIRDKISHAVEIEGFEIKVSISIGVSIFPDNATDVKDLLKLADHAMYFAKKDKDKFYYYCDEVKQEDELPI